MKRKNKTEQLVQYITTIVFVISLAILTVHSFFNVCEVSGHSMESTLSSEDLVLLDTLSYKFLKPGRYDLVSFKRKDGTENIKRIVGLPGETVVIQNGRIYIDGSLLASPKVSMITNPGLAENPVELSDDEFFVLGDNPESSEDSRFLNIGNVKKEQILGRVWLDLKKGLV